jgi:tRNA(Ile)-lysidine synthase
MNSQKGRLGIVAVSGGPDSVFLALWALHRFSRLLIAHFNHGTRGNDSDRDQKFVEDFGLSIGVPVRVGKRVPLHDFPHPPEMTQGEKVQTGFERKAREARYAFLRTLGKKFGAGKILVGHTADDQVETILMRIFEGAGISGLKGIPRETGDGIERPLLATWRDDVVRHLKKKKIPFRVDKSNFDTRFERNWVRHVLLPMLENRYGKSVRKRIFTLGERFRELDAYIGENAQKWLDKNRKFHSKKRKSEVSRAAGDGNKDVTFSRKAFTGLPSVLRMKILQILCFDRIGRSPNERLLESMDKLIVSGGPSAHLSVGRGVMLRCRYREALFSFPKPGEKTDAEIDRTGQKGKGKGQVRKNRTGEMEGRQTGKKKPGREPFLRMDGQGTYRWTVKKEEKGSLVAGSPRDFVWEERARISPGRIRRLADGERCAAFDKEMIASPLSVRPLRAGDRIRPFGLDADKKVKEILIDRKVPREERWGRAVVCDADGKILWIPGVLRSAHAPVTPKTRRTVVLRAEFP